MRMQNHRTIERTQSAQSEEMAGNEHTPLLASDNCMSISADVKLHSEEPEAAVKPGDTESKSVPFSFRSLPGSKKWTMVMMAFANFAACACFSLLAPFFPKEAARKGASQTAIGLIFSSFELVIFVSAPVLGTFLTRIGSRFMFISGLFVCGICTVLFGVLDRCPPDTIFIVMCFLVRSVEAFGASGYITASFAIIANEFPLHVATVFGTLEIFTGLGLMVGPPLGGALYELGGFGLPFWVTGGLLTGCACLNCFLLPSSPDNPHPDRRSILHLLRSPLVVVTAITIVAAAYSLGFLDPTLANHLDQFHLHTTVVGLIFIVAPTIYALTAPVLGYLSDTLGMSRFLIAAGNVVSAVTFLSLGPSPLLPFLKHQLWLVILSLAVFGISVGCALVPTLKCLIIGARKVGFEDNLDTFGLVSGLFNSAFYLGTFLGPTVGSVITQHKGFDWSATVTAAIFAVAAVLFIMYVLIEKGFRRDPGDTNVTIASCTVQENSSDTQRNTNQGYLPFASTTVVPC